MSQILSEQGEMITRATENTKVTNVQLEKGNHELDQAKEYARKERVNRCCFLMWMLLALCAILLPVILWILNSNGVF